MFGHMERKKGKGINKRRKGRTKKEMTKMERKKSNEKGNQAK